jgi:hypothetical protein
VIITRHSSDSPARFATTAGTTAEVVTTGSATAAAAAPIESAAATTAARSTSAAGRFRLCLIHNDRASLHLMLMELLNRFLRRLVICHFNETEPACPSGRHVAHNSRTRDIANSAEECHQIFIRGFIREIADVQPATHGNQPPAEML